MPRINRGGLLKRRNRDAIFKFRGKRRRRRRRRKLSKFLKRRIRAISRGDNTVRWSGNYLGPTTGQYLKTIANCEETATQNDFFNTAAGGGSKGFVCPIIRLCTAGLGITGPSSANPLPYQPKNDERSGPKIFALGVKFNWKIRPQPGASNADPTYCRMVWGYKHVDTNVTADRYIICDEIFSTDGSPAVNVGTINQALYPWSMNRQAVNHEKRRRYHIVGQKVIRVRLGDSDVRSGSGYRDATGQLNWKMHQMMEFDDMVDATVAWNTHISKFEPFILVYADRDGTSSVGADIICEYRFYWKNVN